MMRVKINGGFLTLFPNTTLKYVFNNSAFSENALVGDFSYTLSVPDDDNNALLLGFISDPNLYEGTSEHPCALYEENNLVFDGVFKITSTKKGDKISGNIINSAYDFINQIKDKTTKDIDLGEVMTFESPGAYELYYINSWSGSYPEFKFAVFPLLNNTYLEGTSQEDSWALSPYINGYNGMVRNTIYFPYLAYIIEQLFKYFNFGVENIIAQHSELKKLCLVGVGRAAETYYTIDLHKHVTTFDLTKLLDGIKSLFGISFYFNNAGNFVKMIFHEDLLKKTDDYEDWTDIVSKDPEKKIEYNDEGYTLSHAFDSSDTTISDLQLPPGVLDNAIISDPVLTPLQLPIYQNMGINQGEIRFVTCEQCYYMIVDVDENESTTDFQWKKLSWNFFGKKVGEGKKERQSTLTTLGMNWHEYKARSFTWMTPHSDQVLLENPLTGTLALLHPGNTNYELVAPVENEFEPRVLFFRNLQPDAFDQPYPLGTSGKHDAKGNVIGTLTLHWDGPDGLYENFWKKWLTFLEKGVAYEVPVMLSLTQILNLKLYKQVKIGSNFYIIKKLTVDFPIKKAATAEIVRI